jgi:hypothetical protein
VLGWGHVYGTGNKIMKIAHNITKVTIHSIPLSVTAEDGIGKVSGYIAGS